MDMTNERVKLGVALMQSEFKDQYKDLFSYWCNQLAKDGYCYIADVEDIKEVDTSMYNFLSSRNIVSTYGISINDSEGYLIGYIALDFMVGDHQDFTKIQECLKDKKIKIETLMSIK